MQHGRLQWFGYVEQMENHDWVNRIKDLDVEGHKGRGRRRKTWDQIISSDLHDKGLERALAQDCVM